MARMPSFTSEKNLLDALNRIMKNPAGYSVLYVSISKLKPKNRPPEFVKVIAKLFDGLVGASGALMFILSNSDIVILGRQITHLTVDDAVKKLRLGLSSDPILYSQDSENFARVYDFPIDFAEFYALIEGYVTNAAMVDDVFPKMPIESSQVDGILEQLNNIDIAEMVKRQSVLQFKGAGKMEVLFQEFFVAVKDLSSKFDAGIDLIANKWLFLYISQTLDKKTISSFFLADLQRWPKKISMNLNLTSVFSKEFVHFAKNFLKDDQKIIVEVQLMDAFNNLALYFEAKEILHRGGHKLLIDAMSPSSLEMLNIKKFAPDMIKIFWEPLLEYDLQNQRLKEAVEFIGKDKVILAKCDSESAVRWGVKYGITSFQGPYIDNIEVAMTRAGCCDAKQCTAQNCLKRKRLLAGALRDECTQKQCLEKLL